MSILAYDADGTTVRTVTRRRRVSFPDLDDVPTEEQVQEYLDRVAGVVRREVGPPSKELPQPSWWHRSEARQRLDRALWFAAAAGSVVAATWGACH